VGSPILVTGGTGTLGRRVVPLLRDAGCEVRVMSRHGHDELSDAGRAPLRRATRRDGVRYVTGDLSTGEGVDAAVAGTGTIVHLAGTQKGDGDKARHLVRAASRAGADHLVYISVVGAERVPVVSAVDRAMFGYFASKRDAEEVVAGSGLPWTTLRASQFHDLIYLVVRQLAKLPVIPVPGGARFQPVDAGDVAARLVELALGKPAGLVPDMAGPRVYGLDELIRSYLAATHRRRLLLRVPMGGRAYRAVRAGANLAPDGTLGTRTWEEHLAAALV
jgi:uncharacterized protein YbjT (DUF2867 family)